MESNTESFNQTEGVDNGMEQLNGIRSILTRLIYDKAIAIAEFVNGRKVGLDIVRNAFSFVLPKGELYAKTNDYADSRVKDVFETTTLDRVDMRKPKVEISTMAKMSDAASVYLEAIVSYLIDLIVSNAPSQSAYGYSRSIQSSSSLNEMFEKNKIYILSNTVSPYLSFGLFRKARSECETPEDTDDDDDSDTSRKSKILGIVKGLQEKGDCIVLPRSAMSRIIREICLDIDPSSKVGMDTPIYLQYIIEQEMISLIRSASYVSYASKSTKLSATDLDIAIAIKYNQFPIEFNYSVEAT